MGICAIFDEKVCFGCGGFLTFRMRIVQPASFHKFILVPGVCQTGRQLLWSIETEHHGQEKIMMVMMMMVGGQVGVITPHPPSHPPHPTPQKPHCPQGAHWPKPYEKASNSSHTASFLIFQLVMPGFRPTSGSME